jgi:hypothetical protein
MTSRSATAAGGSAPAPGRHPIACSRTPRAPCSEVAPRFLDFLVSSPNAYGEDLVLFDLEDAYGREHDDLDANVFIVAGTGEILSGGAVSTFGCVSGAVRMAELLGVREYPSLRHGIALLEDEDHTTMTAHGLVAGLRALSSTEPVPQG